MFLKEIHERIEKTNDQRLKMALTLTSIMNNVTGDINLSLRSTVAINMLDMLESSMISEDKPLIKMFNDAIDSVCKDAEELTGHSDFRSHMKSILNKAKAEAEKQIKAEKEEAERLKVADDILNSIKFDGFNLN